MCSTLRSYHNSNTHTYMCVGGGGGGGCWGGGGVESVIKTEFWKSTTFRNV